MRYPTLTPEDFIRATAKITGRTYDEQLAAFAAAIEENATMARHADGTHMTKQEREAIASGAASPAPVPAAPPKPAPAPAKKPRRAKKPANARAAKPAKKPRK